MSISCRIQVDTYLNQVNTHCDTRMGCMNPSWYLHMCIRTARGPIRFSCSLAIHWRLHTFAFARRYPSWVCFSTVIGHSPVVGQVVARLAQWSDKWFTRLFVTGNEYLCSGNVTQRLHDCVLRVDSFDIFDSSDSARWMLLIRAFRMWFDYWLVQVLASHCLIVLAWIDPVRCFFLSLRMSSYWFEFGFHIHFTFDP